MFTKGPWGINGNKMVIFRDEPRDQKPIAVISTGTIYGAYDSSEYIANAHLIAAAPDLYEALKELFHNCEAPGKYLDMAGEAILKAEGK